MKKRHQFNPMTVSIVFSLAAAVIFSAVTMLFSHTRLEKSLAESTDAFIQKNDIILENFARALELQIDSYKKSLQSLLPQEMQIINNGEGIQEYLISHAYQNNADFSEVFFTDRDGMSWHQNGQKIDVTGRDYYEEIILKGSSTFLSSEVISKNSITPTVVLALALFDTRGAVQGAICASILPQTLENYLTQISAENDLFLYDTNGNTICESELFKGRKIISDAIQDSAGSPRQNRVAGVKKITLDTNRQDAHIFYQQISNSSWTMILITTEEQDLAFTDRVRHLKLENFIFAVLLILVLFLLEFLVARLMKKREMFTAIYDPLTGLANRSHFEQEASKILRLNAGSKLMLIECDIKSFKFINQNYGEEDADALLVYLAQLLREFTRDFDGFLGRGFADRFYILIKINTVHSAMRIFNENLKSLNAKIKQYDIPFTVKFGITFRLAKNSTRKATIQELIGQASFAKNTIKNSITQYAIYNGHLLEKINKERYIENHMEQALQDGEFFVMYQPKISLLTDKIVGAEALVRWTNPKLGTMRPDSFIELFEQNGFIKKVDFYVYEQVFKFLQSRIDKEEAIVPISINMSRNHSKPDKFMRDFLDIFKRYSIPANYIEVEILERSVMDNNTLKEITDLLHKEGFTVAMDDFGSGESSLNMLTQIPVDVLKFDRSFLMSSTTDDGALDPMSATFISTLVSLSKNLRKATVFEGVETEIQRDFLRSTECDQVQGFLYSKPLTESDFVTFMEAHL